MTSRSERDKVLDEVISTLDEMRTWKEDTDDLKTKLDWACCIYHACKGVYMLMDDPKDNLE